MPLLWRISRLAQSTREGCLQAHPAAKAAMVALIGKWLPEHPDVTYFTPQPASNEGENGRSDPAPRVRPRSGAAKRAVRDAAPPTHSEVPEAYETGRAARAA